MSIKLGDIFTTRYYGDVEIVEYLNARKVKVRFLNTGFEDSYCAGDIRRGFIRDKSCKRVVKHKIPDNMLVGSKLFIEKYSSVVEVLKYIDANNVTILFQDTGYMYTTCVHSIRNGLIRDPFKEKVLGVGVNDLTGKPYNKEVYSLWKSMLDRVYSPNKECYEDVNICKDWLLFSNFNSWVETHDRDEKVLDKDLKSRGVKIYSPETCTFIPEKINSVITTFRAGKTKGYYFNKGDPHCSI